MKIRNVISNINPFNNKQEMPTTLYVIKKMLAFLVIQISAAVIGEVLIIGALTVMGYNPTSGDMPGGHFAELSQYFGFAIFIIIALLYCKFIEKTNLKTIGFNKKVYDFLPGGFIALILLTVIATIACVTGSLSLNNINSNIDVIYLIALFFGFIIQSFAEEIICRGFLLTSLSKKVSLPLAVFVSSTAFALPHLPSLLDADTVFVVIGLLNIYLVSTVFSLLFVLRSNIFIIGGLHSIWNFVLYGVMGLTVSGGNGSTNGIINFVVNSGNIFNGGIYGLEASIITTVTLGITVIILVKLLKNRRVKNGL